MNDLASDASIPRIMYADEFSSVFEVLVSLDFICVREKDTLVPSLTSMT